MELRKYIHKAVSRNVVSITEQARCVDRVYDLLSERERQDPGFQQRITGLLSRHEFRRSPDWKTLQEILSSAVKLHHN